MKTIARLVLAFTLAAAAFASEPWTAADKERQAVLTAVILADWAQTRYIAVHPARHEFTTPGPVVLPNGQIGYDAGHAVAVEGFREINPLLGSHPKDHEVNAYFAASLALSYWVADRLPSRYRATFQYLYIGLEGFVVARNIKFGVRMRF